MSLPEVIEADPEFSSTALCMLALGCLYFAYLVWGTTLLYLTRGDANDTDCNKGELWWIIFTAVVVQCSRNDAPGLPQLPSCCCQVGWLGSCSKLCNVQSAHDAAHFGATGSLAILMQLRHADSSCAAKAS